MIEQQLESKVMYVYGYTRSKVQPGVYGIGGAEVQLHKVEDVAVVTSEIPEGQVAAKEILLGHERVISDILEQAPVVPQRVGFFANTEEISDYVRGNYRWLIGLLDRFEYCVEVKVRAVYVEPAVLREVRIQEPRLAQAGQGYDQQLQAGQRVVEILQRKRVKDQCDLLDRLSKGVEDVAHHAEDELTVLNASFLLKKASLSGFEEVLNACAERQRGRIDFRYVAPLAPYSFIR